MIVDLRSDTVTKPSAEMRRVIASAEVGDDVLGDDPTVHTLEQRSAELLGMQAAVFTPSGTLANQLAIRAICEPGDELIIDQTTHSYNYETGASAALAGCSFHLIRSSLGIYGPEDVHAGVRPDNIHAPKSRMVIIENTNNRGGGAVWSVEQVAEVAQAGRSHALHVHIDGARLMNAAVATGVPPTAFTQHADTVSLCFSKGLGAPVGSVIAGSEAFIARARRFRKMYGGAMRQAGLLAAAAIYALENNVERLAVDHANARKLGEAVHELPGLSTRLEALQSNIVMIDIDAKIGSGQQVADRLEASGVRVLSLGPRSVRAVTHLDVDQAGIDAAIGAFRALAS